MSFWIRDTGWIDVPRRGRSVIAASRARDGDQFLATPATAERAEHGSKDDVRGELRKLKRTEDGSFQAEAGWIASSLLARAVDRLHGAAAGIDEWRRQRREPASGETVGPDVDMAESGELECLAKTRGREMRAVPFEIELLALHPPPGRAAIRNAKVEVPVGGEFLPHRRGESHRIGEVFENVKAADHVEAAFRQ